MTGFDRRMAKAIPYLVAMLLAASIIIAILYSKALDSGTAANHLADVTQQSNEMANCRSAARNGLDRANALAQAAQAQVVFSQNQGLAAEVNGGVAVESDGRIVTLAQIIARSAAERAAVIATSNGVTEAQKIYNDKVNQAINNPDAFLADCKAHPPDSN